MRIQQYVVPDEKLELVCLGDLHFGHVNCDVDMIENVINYIKENDCYWLGGGDYGDAIVVRDKRFDYRTVNPDYKTPQEQYGWVEEAFKPISKKCLGLLDGNHDIIHWKRSQHNYVKELAERLEIPYLTIDAYLRFKFEDYTDFDVYAHHGWTGSRNKGAKINRIYDLEGVFPMIDLYIMFHTHDLGIVDKKANLYVDHQLEIRDHIAWFLFGGSFLKGYVKNQISYVEEQTYRPTVLGSPVLTIKPVKGKGTVWFDVQYKEIR